MRFKFNLKCMQTKSLYNNLFHQFRIFMYFFISIIILRNDTWTYFILCFNLSPAKGNNCTMNNPPFHKLTLHQQHISKETFMIFGKPSIYLQKPIFVHEQAYERFHQQTSALSSVKLLIMYFQENLCSLHDPNCQNAINLKKIEQIVIW